MTAEDPMTTQEPEEDVELTPKPRPAVPPWVAVLAVVAVVLAVRRRRRRRRARALEASVILVSHEPADTELTQLDVWERAIDAVESAAVRDIALGSADTADRQSAAG
jgi:hypothetical protein